MVFCCFGCVSKKVSGCWFLALLEAAAAVKIGDQNWLSSRVSEGTFRPPGNRLLRLILRHFRHEIRWCFAVSAAFRKRCLAAGFLLFIEAAAAIKIGRNQNWTKLDFYSRISEGTLRPPKTYYCD